jgi:hypothetical protein
MMKDAERERYAMWVTVKPGERERGNDDVKPVS